MMMILCSGYVRAETWRSTARKRGKLRCLFAMDESTQQTQVVLQHFSNQLELSNQNFAGLKIGKMDAGVPSLTERSC